jgi:hypothetical protein
MSEPLELYPFSYWDEMRKRWVKARYVATKADIEARHPKHRIKGPPEIRAGGPSGFMVRPPR